MPSYTIDPVTLREVPDDVGAARAHVAALTARGPDGDAERVFWLRVLGELDEAARLGRAVVQRAEPGTAQHAAALLRLAHVLQWQGRFAEADALFDDALRQARRLEHTALTAFALQHSAKSLFDQRRHAEALDRFTEALRLREADGAPADQIASTRQALAATRAAAG
ncbi:hypothetical protein DNL40_08935 [Xylanimonas oleitrophica]|uniref:Uncharacterized protein n=1 Tax=Xylanimonas oleitrophica TaxID=2607479 RepID=A0A2W5XT04_9MICO|nr:tetratricopeptide repeat protein [Xylanimonas oleitrophica]PZR53118.1 hypothetical protein DNL40_08935 [Xylanimonas oleitrophica]